MMGNTQELLKIKERKTVTFFRSLSIKKEDKA